LSGVSPSASWFTVRISSSSVRYCFAASHSVSPAASRRMTSEGRRPSSRSGTVCTAVVLALFGGGLDRDYATLLLVESICAPLLANAGLLLLSFRFGSTKARYLYFVIVALFAGLLGFGVSSDDELGHAMAAAPLPALLGVTALSLVLYAASWKLSTVWYGKSRE